MKQCPQCHKEFEVKKYQSVTAFCSQHCQRKFNQIKRRKPLAQKYLDVDELLKAARNQ